MYHMNKVTHKDKKSVDIILVLPHDVLVLLLEVGVDFAPAFGNFYRKLKQYKKSKITIVQEGLHRV
jgi:hypothetical protein